MGDGRKERARERTGTEGRMEGVEKEQGGRSPGWNLGGRVVDRQKGYIEERREGKEREVVQNGEGGRCAA
jgi:hypothetical protein